jgi:hypothetical protein
MQTTVSGELGEPVETRKTITARSKRAVEAGRDLQGAYVNRLRAYRINRTGE